jgi:NCAIR mutase (PurE)-related protein
LDKEKIQALLEGVRDGKVAIADALRTLKSLPYQDLGFAKIDTHRHLRNGFSEVIYARGKTLEEIKAIVGRASGGSSLILATKASPEVYKAVLEVRPDAVYHEKAQIVVIGKPRKATGASTIAVVCAGTSDLPIAEEAAVTAAAMGNEVVKIYDVGVAGLHRLFGSLDALLAANVVVVVAGMDGALPSVIGGLIDKPIVAVPTSVGYGANFNGLAPLLTMLNSCSPGVSVVNIDNGFGAGFFASMVNRLCEGNNRP